MWQLQCDLRDLMRLDSVLSVVCRGVAGWRASQKSTFQARPKEADLRQRGVRHLLAEAHLDPLQLRVKRQPRHIAAS